MTNDLDLSALRAYLLGHERVITARAARTELGLTASDLSRLVTRGVLVRVCRGGYADASAFVDASPEERHELRLRAVLATNVGYAASHQSAALMLGLPMMAADLSRIHVVRRTGSGHGRRRSAFTVHEDRPTGFHQVRGLWVVAAADAVMGAMRGSGDISAQAVADATLRLGLVSQEELGRLAARGGAGVRRAVEHADPSSESVGESAARQVMRLLGYVVRTQVEFRDDRGFVGRVDFHLPELGVVVEFDGAVKYAGAEGRQALVREKAREDRLRALGLAVVRLVWSDLSDPELVRRKIEQAAASVRARHTA
ncbi:hypothetical protein SGUI_0083 [Serinicoccus hydrothermalis]|uniref:AbiEi antitoxin N-terminal domain-containing protein n=1 Tax=Serinicoccus hydrothermalis TaxID=1758689 RepID=A0A1B1N7S2_9MICO|nr:type IV toxin-antitoxin system AbiEi family antitoxin domain-containing protein [Serinicoccus hydrothermalis]ANS77479.1 hypothetical protein SGUI_0083 [Serinicoccus hydrothermalis]